MVSCMSFKSDTPEPNQNLNLSHVDKAINGFDRVLRTLTTGNTSHRPSPAKAIDNPKVLTENERKHAAGLMRVNHAGEVCAQALYQGQALTAKLPEIRQEMDSAAQEERDHLAWCEDSLDRLNAQPSLLNPLWYGLSFSLGAGAGLISDKVSLGFVAATENQVCEHLEKHMEGLPENDHKSKAVVKQMLEDEDKHAQSALAAGGYDFPRPVKKLMSVVSKVMTESSYRI